MAISTDKIPVHILKGLSQCLYYRHSHQSQLVGNRRNFAFFKRKSRETIDADSNETRRHNNKFDGPLTQQTTGTLKEFGSARTTPAYNPPADVETRLRRIVTIHCGENTDWKQISLKNPTLKFKILTNLMTEFEHDISNCDMDQITTINEALNHFLHPVKDTTSYEDLSRLPLPPNLHIQMEPVRFQPETDTVFDGVTAFPGRPTIMSSLKYRRKYAGVKFDDTLPEGYVPRKGDE